MSIPRLFSLTFHRLPWVLGSVLPVLVWYAITAIFPKEIHDALPPISMVANDLWVDHQHWQFLAWTTLRASFAGFILGAGTALLAAAACIVSEPVEALLTPSAVILKAVPAIAFAPLVAVVVPSPLWGRAVIGAAICFFPLFIGSRDAGQATPDRVLTLARVYGATSSEQFLQIQAVYMLYGAATAAKIAAPLAVIGAVIGEWFGGNPPGLGTYFRPIVATADLIHTYSATVLAAAIGLFLYFTMGALGGALDRRLHLRA